MLENNFLTKLLDGQKVEWKSLGEVCDFQRGKTITAKNKTHGNIPVISGGRKPAYYNAGYNRENETITVAGSGAYAGHIMYWNEPIFVSDAFSIKPNLLLLVTRYVYHFLLNNQLIIYNLKKGSGVPHVYPKDLEKLQIPIPCPENPAKSLEIQQKIVNILDKFTQLTTQLTTELQNRKKQYSYYRDKLLTFNDDEVEWKSLGEVCDINTGQKPPQILDKKTNYDYINAGTTRSGYCMDSNCLGDTVTTPSRGQGGIGYVGYQKSLFWLGPLCYRIRSCNHSQLINKYIFYFLESQNNLLLELKKEGGVPAVNKVDLAKISIPIPPLSHQKKIVNILDKFDSLTNSISEGLPREIELRQKQYEYYRDLLLNFPKEEK
jgi:type I restriction enzyme S subunit